MTENVTELHERIGKGRILLILKIWECDEPSA